MKGCFILQRQFAHLGHDIVRHLQERHGLTGACAYVYQRSGYEFLKNQKDVQYSTLLLDEEIHERFRTETLDPAFLDDLEKTYGQPFLWHALTVDRVLMSGQLVREYPYDQPMYSHEDLLRILQVKAKAIIEMLDRERPDFLFCSVVGAVGSWLLYHIAKQRGIPTYVILMTGTRNRYVISEAYDRFTDVDARFHGDRETLKRSPTWKEAETFLAEFRQKPLPYFDRSTPSQQPVSRANQWRFLKPSNAIRSFHAWFDYFARFYRAPGQKDFTAINPWVAVWDTMKRKTRNLIGLDDLYDDVTPEEDYVYFPLHFEPEIATLLLAPHATEQMEVIRHLAHALPLRFKLYVKEHPEMVQYRTRAWYQQLKKIPNVKLIRPNIKGFALIARAKLVATIAGSSGWEAMMLKKPIVTFGHWFFNSLPSVQHVTDPERIADAVQHQLMKFEHNEEEIVAYLACLFEESAHLNFHHLWIDERDAQKIYEGVRPIADLLARKIRRAVDATASSANLQTL